MIYVDYFFIYNFKVKAFYSKFSVLAYCNTNFKKWGHYAGAIKIYKLWNSGSFPKSVGVHKLYLKKNVIVFLESLHLINHCSAEKFSLCVKGEDNRYTLYNCHFSFGGERKTDGLETIPLFKGNAT